MKNKLIMTFAWLFLALVAKAEATNILQYPNVIYVEGMHASPGSVYTMTIKMKNAVAMTGFQFDLKLPNGVTVATDTKGFQLITLSQIRTTTQKTDYFGNAIQGDGSIRVMASSTNNYTFSGNDGDVVTIDLNVAESVAVGSYPIVIKNIVLSDANSQTYEVEQVEMPMVISSEIPASSDEDTDVSKYDDIVYIEAQQVTPGDIIDVPILLKNSLPTSGFTFTLVLPEGFSIVEDSEGYPQVSANVERFGSLNRASCYGDYDADKNIEIKCTTTNATRYQIVGNEGIVATIQVKVSDTLKKGLYPFFLKKISISNENETEIRQIQTSFKYGNGWVCNHIQGDVNGDGKVNIDDLTTLVNILLNR